MGFFNRNTRPDILSKKSVVAEDAISVEDVITDNDYISVTEFHMLIATMCAQYAERMQNMKFEDCTNKKEILEILGFTNSRTYKDIVDSDKKYKEYETLKFFKTIFPKSLFMKLDDFKSLCKNYGLVCGDTNEFKGEIPEKNLEEIEDAFWIISKNKEAVLDINKGYYSFSRIIFSHGFGINEVNTIDQEFVNFHFLHDDDYTIDTIGEGERSYGIFADKHYLKPDQFLIAANGDEMGIIKFDRIELITPDAVLKNDPIVFQMLPHKIVMIHSKWGDEANDPMLEENRL